MKEHTGQTDKEYNKTCQELNNKMTTDKQYERKKELNNMVVELEKEGIINKTEYIDLLENIDNIIS